MIQLKNLSFSDTIIFDLTNRITGKNVLHYNDAESTLDKL